MRIARISAFIASCMMSCCILLAEAQEPVVQQRSLSLTEMESIFLEKNLELIALKFNIEGAKGAAIQAGLWRNPNLTLEQSIFQFWKNVKEPGYDTEVWLQQVLTIAKREKAAQVGNEDTKIATHAFFNTMRSLKFQLRQSFYQLYFSKKTLSFYDTTIGRLKAAVHLPDDLHKVGTKSLSELLRFKTLLVTFENERLDVLRQVNQLQGTLRVLLGEASGSTQEFAPVLNENELLKKHAPLTKNEAIEKAKASRQDLQMAQTFIKREQTNVSLQKLGWLPDFTLGLHYAKSGGFDEDYVGLTLSFDLPFVDHSQGNLQTAKAAVQSRMHTRDLFLLALENEVALAFDNAQKTDALLKEVGPNYTKNLSQLVLETIRQYKEGRIGIIAFADFYEAHRTSIVQINQLEAKRLIAFEELNYAMGIDG
jgi:outer membrane protein TolC